MVMYHNLHFHFLRCYSTNTSTVNNAQPQDIHRIDQRIDNVKALNKTKNKITKNVNRGNDIRVGNGKQRPQPRLQLFTAKSKSPPKNNRFQITRRSRITS